MKKLIVGYLKNIIAGISLKKTLRDIVIFALIITGASFYIQRTMISGPAPELLAITTNGKTVSLESNTKPALIYFWGTWCPYCRFTSPLAERIAKDYPVISIAVRSGSNQDINRYLKEHNLTFDALNDGNGYYSDKWGVSGVPGFFIVDNNGRITSKTQGPTTSWGLRLRLWLAE